MSMAPYEASITKALEIVQSVIDPWTTKRQGRAESAALRDVADAKREIAELDARARRRATEDEIRWQANLESISDQARAVLEDKAARKLLPERVDSGESDPDWFHKWAGYAKETSDEEIRALWARVLAGEIIERGKFSLRLLHLISLLRKSEARDFELFSKFVWQDSDGSLLQPYTNATEQYLKVERGIHRSFYSRLSNLGLISDFGRELLTDWRIRKGAHLTYNKRSYRFELVTNLEEREPMMVRDVTPLGAELFELCQPEQDQTFADRLIDSLLSRGAFSGWQINELTSEWNNPILLTGAISIGRKSDGSGEVI